MKKALETPLQALREDQPTFWHVTQVKSVIVYVSRADGFLNLVPYAVPCDKCFCFQRLHVETCNFA